MAAEQARCCSSGLRTNINEFRAPKSCEAVASRGVCWRSRSKRTLLTLRLPCLHTSAIWSIWFIYFSLNWSTSPDKGDSDTECDWLGHSPFGHADSSVARGASILQSCDPWPWFRSRIAASACSAKRRRRLVNDKFSASAAISVLRHIRCK